MNQLYNYIQPELQHLGRYYMYVIDILYSLELDVSMFTLDDLGYIVLHTFLIKSLDGLLNAVENNIKIVKNNSPEVLALLNRDTMKTCHNFNIKDVYIFFAHYIGSCGNSRKIVEKLKLLQTLENMNTIETFEDMIACKNLIYNILDNNILFSCTDVLFPRVLLTASVYFDHYHPPGYSMLSYRQHRKRNNNARSTNLSTYFMYRYGNTRTHRVNNSSGLIERFKFDVDNYNIIGRNLIYIFYSLCLRNSTSIEKCVDVECVEKLCDKLRITINAECLLKLQKSRNSVCNGNSVVVDCNYHYYTILNMILDNIPTVLSSEVDELVSSDCDYEFKKMCVNTIRRYINYKISSLVDIK